ncbi:MAG: TIGR04255 family protein [Alphaproteobacteria bacterium]|nr:TIGR04255 family protein [Alphaproteobacteria bacterium]
MGVRYINRIDIPEAGQKIELENYFKIYPRVPKKKFPAFTSFSAQTVAAIESYRILTINVHGSDEPPLLNFGSIIFDIDIAQSKNLPNNNVQLFCVLDEIRNNKNYFFEDLLTAKCKRLFN